MDSKHQNSASDTVGELETHTYDPNTLESAIQAQWSSQPTNEQEQVQLTDQSNKFYCLAMFPYPSGLLHVGHVRNYTIGDVIARSAKLAGKTVLQPIGWDSFGLPAENAAIKHGVHPLAWTEKNIAIMRKQFKRLGFDYNWAHELRTCDPEYYRWEQWLFLQMFERGLVYQRKAEVNWDPVDQTVLANEQVVDGRGWRSGAVVERRAITQWFMKITDYADELLDDLDQLEHWPEGVRTMQRNWIGRSTGAQIRFKLDAPITVAAADNESDTYELSELEVFTTRADTLFGATFIAIAPNHALTLTLAKKDPELLDFVAQMNRGKTAEADLANLPKAGRSLGIHIINPINGARVPVWTVNYVLANYGTGVVMCVPAHDQRDWEFAQQYQLPIQPVIANEDLNSPHDYNQAAYCQSGTLINSGQYSGVDSELAREQITQALQSAGQGHEQVQYRLRDWSVSRQRYWGAPIPIIYCPACGVQGVPAADLPVELPTEIELSGRGGSPLANHASFKNTTCPKCGGAAQRETDTFDTFMESSWYYARFACPDLKTAMLDQRAQAWMPVDQYIGGIEHATMHLLYSRFIHKVLRDIGLVNSNEPFTRLLCQGMVLAETYYGDSPSGERLYYNRQEVTLEKDDKGQTIRATSAAGLSLNLGSMEKMSKSKNNGVDPEALIDRYGADTIRLFAMFAAPPEQTLEWSDAGVEGAYRFLKRVYKLCQEHRYSYKDQSSNLVSMTNLNTAQQNLRRLSHATLQKVRDDFERRQSFNTGIAALMKLANSLGQFTAVSPQDLQIQHESLSMLLVMLSPIAPHISQTLWQQLNANETTVMSWPEVDDTALVADTQTLVVQVNGKKRAELEISTELDGEAIKTLAQSDEQVQRFTKDLTIVKVIYVPNRLVNIVGK